MTNPTKKEWEKEFDKVFEDEKFWSGNKYGSIGERLEKRLKSFIQSTINKEVKEALGRSRFPLKVLIRQMALKEVEGFADTLKNVKPDYILSDGRGKGKWSIPLLNQIKLNQKIKKELEGRE